MASTSVTARINPLYWWWLFCAHRGRKEGHYNRRTRHYFFRVWHLSGRPDDLLAYLLFRRDLGCCLSTHRARDLEQNIHRLKPGRQVLAAALLIEASGRCPAFLSPEPTFLVNSIQLPAVLACLYKNDVELSVLQRRFSQLQDQQAQWRDEFQAELLRQYRQGGERSICVVGNAANMRGALLGDTINQYDCVVRFNTFVSPETNRKDMGHKHNVWVVTPNLQITELPDGFSGTVILTGPDMRYRLLNWSGLSPVVESGLRILTVPLFIWRELVRELAAPPSAGLLFLAWLRYLLGGWSGVSVAGFGALSERGDYHHTSARHKAATRHNWVAEADLLQRWQQAGLHSLHG